jgi:3D (Asp-Asp-Asp) domain-containing protein
MHDDLKLAAREKVVQKMTRDGMVEQNLADKSSRRVSGRIEDAVLRREAESEEALTVTSSDRARKRRRAQRIRDADASKKPDVKNTGQDTVATSDQTASAVGEQSAQETLDKSSLQEESVRSRISEEADPVKQAAAKRRKRNKKRLYEEAGKRKKSRLAFDDEQTLKKPIGTGSVSAGAATVSGRIRQSLNSNEDDNSGLQAAGAAEEAAEGTAGRLKGAVSRGYRNSRQGAYRLEKAELQKTSRLMFDRMPEETRADTKSFVKRQQKKRLQRGYAAGWRAAKAGETAAAAKAASASASPVRPSLAARLRNGVKRFAARHKGAAVAVICMVLGLVLFGSMVAMMGAMISMAGNAIVETTYLAADDEMLAVEARYLELEAALQRQIDGIETTYPGYDEYRYQINEIYHNPYQLISYFTTMYGSFTYDQVKDEVEEIFREQYGIDITGERVTVTETREVGVGESLGSVVTSGYCNCPICCGRWSGGPTASGAYPTSNHTIAVDASNPFVPMGTKVIMNGVEYTVEDTGAFARYGVQFDVYYDSHSAASAHGHQTWEAYLADDNSSTTVEVTTTRNIRRLSTVMTGNSLDQVLRARMNEDQINQYQLYNATYGNRQDLFDVAALQIPDGMSYEIPPEALSDERFVRMITEAEKYLGYPYVWGGASPSTSFDCSGFVSWVINHSGNGWNYGRLTAEGLRNVCTYVSPSEAKPGDLIFFQGTYDTAGASHVGIYVGNGMMIHCGNPIQYASIETSYWQQHFYCFGRLP